MLRAYCQQVGPVFRDSLVYWESLSETVFQQIFYDIWEPRWFDYMKTSSGIKRRPKASPEYTENEVKSIETHSLIERLVNESIKYCEEWHADRLQLPFSLPR